MRLGGAELWRTLAMAGAKATAEALEDDDLRRMHVAGPLDTFIAARVAAGCSVILTGNAGDGKTHALRVASRELEQAGAVVVGDATALMLRGDPTPVLARWREADARGVPFCLAINEYPLYQLRRAAPEFAPLTETWRQCRGRLAYGDVKEDVPFPSLVVVDLSIRNPLAPDFVLAVLDAVLDDPDFVAAAAAEPGGSAASNASRLRESRVRDRLRATLAGAVALGARATVREVWILVARMVMGTSGRGDHARADWYFEPLFARGELAASGPLARALDPASCSHPIWDSRLEAGLPELEAGWRLGRPPVPPQPRLDPRVFAWLKRAFYFEHEHGEAALELAEPEAAEFHDLLRGAGSGSRPVVALVDAINAAYCPAKFSGREHHLYLWSGHRFHEQPSRSFVATERIGVDDLRLEAPRLPLRVEGAFEFHRDHLMLIAPGRDGARLRIDYALYRTLRRLGRGLPRKLIPEREVHRLDTFLEELGGARRSGGGTVWSVHLEHMQVLRVGLSPEGDRYESVRANA
jgi:hypothetical protein